MKATPQILDSLPDDEKRKKFLKAENKQLRDNLKRMSENVNVLIEKMNQESMRRQKVAALMRDGDTDAKSNNGSYLAEREVQNTDKAIVNLMKEHNKLKKRLEIV